MAKLDERGSKLQHDIYNLTCRAFKPYKVVYEYPIGDLGQRIDIFIPLLGIAIEVDGKQHEQFTSFFHKDESSWNYSVKLDKDKDKYLYNKGVKLLRIPYNTSIKTEEDLILALDAIEYPPFEYDIIETESSYQKLKKERIKEQQQEYKLKQKQRKKNLEKEKTKGV